MSRGGRPSPDAAAEGRAARAAEAAARASYGRLIALLARRSRDIAAAEDALGEAFAAALRRWPQTGAPRAPDAWLLTVARRSLGRSARSAERRRAAARMLEIALEEREAAAREARATPDDRLALLFVCAHPAIDPAARTPLMLQTVLGLDATRIAAAYQTGAAAMAQRLVRAKAKIRDAGLAFEPPEPDALAPRLGDVLAAIYAAFGAGWDEACGASDGDARGDGLAAEAIYLARLLVELAAEPAMAAEARGLLALMLFCDARRPARRRADGGFAPLSEQDTRLWRREAIFEAEGLLALAARAGRPGRFQIEAAIQSFHCQRGLAAAAGAPTPPAALLVRLYDVLLHHAPSLGAEVGRSAALAEAGAPEAALAALAKLAPERVRAYQPYWATRAHLLYSVGRAAEAAADRARAIALTQDPAARAHLEAAQALDRSARSGRGAMTRLHEHAAAELRRIEAEGLTKREREIVTPQRAHLEVAGPEGRRPLLNLCANNYLGLADHPRLIAAAKAALDSHGFGMASVRFICGASDLHHRLERRLAAFKATEDAILYASCFDANAGLFETLLGPEDAIVSDALNHASIIDGVRLCKARRFRYANNDMADLEAQLRAAQGARRILVATDGVFSMDGVIADLRAICDLAERYGAEVMVDDSHAVGFMGARGAGSVEHCGVEGRVSLITGTFGKALGGASGGYTAGPAAVVELLRQRSRPYLFSNSLAPMICAATLEALDLLAESAELRLRLAENAAYFRAEMTKAGFRLAGAGHPIVPVMIGEAAVAANLAAAMGERGVYVTAFSFPVVPKGQARIRTQMSAAHSRADLDLAAAAFVAAGREVGAIG